MRKIKRRLSRCPVILFAFLLAMCAESVNLPTVHADEDRDKARLSGETLLLYGRVERALKDLDGFLQAIDFENSAVIGTNYFAVSVGGIDAIRDLEEGRGVDPETYAALYAGYAKPEVAKHLNLQKTESTTGALVLRIKDADGRLRYKGTAVRLYSPTRLRSLFQRRESFRNENDRQRRAVFGLYVFERQQRLGRIRDDSDRTEVQELSDRYRKLQPLLNDLDAALRGEAVTSSVIAGSNSQHFFGYSLGGIDVLTDLSERHAVDPETLAAIYAEQISDDYVDSFQFLPNGNVEYDGEQIKLYSADYLVECFKRRDRLVLQSYLR
ncbi:MAG: hypothetical protein GY903_19680 [Fuerstiella sp.]|nr:hypothetical protein [Fuerstiella sp.]MCP4856708.1 hypothetical protein [Fuerstiella sp.]